MCEAVDRAAHEVPSPVTEGAVEIRDQVVLHEVKLDFVEQVGEKQRPEFARGQRVLWRGAFGRLSCGRFPGFAPSGREDVLGIEP